MFERRQALFIERIAATAALALVVGCSTTMSSDEKNGLDLGKGGSGGTSGQTGGNGSGAVVGTDGGTSGSGGTVGGGQNGSGATGAVPTIDPTQGMTTGGTTGSMGGEGGCVPEPEVCDGVDNDCNGIIDDVDAGHDGVCDCLNIATIGQIGPWSDGGDVFKSWLNARTPQGAVALDDQVLTPEVLAPFEVVVALHVATTDVTNQDRGVTASAHHEFSDDEVSAFEDWIKHGGGAMTTIGYAADEANEVTNVNLLLAPFGLAYSNTKLDLDGYITDWTSHPVTMGISNIFTQNGVEADGKNGKTLAKDSSGRVALQVAEPGDGHVVVWGDEWITYDSEWSDVKGQQVELFWLNILKWLSPPKTCQVPIPPGIVK